MNEIPNDVRRALTEGLDALKAGGVRHVEHDGHHFAVVMLTSAGIHTGHPRYLVACRTCFKLVHDGTTDPLHAIEIHLREIERSKGVHPELADAFELGQLRAKAAEPIPMRITCPECKTLHIDEGDFATKPHHTHVCQSCGLTWRPALVNTVGVRFLPGFKNEPTT